CDNVRMGRAGDGRDEDLGGSGLSILMRLTTSETFSSVPSSADLHVPVSTVPPAAGVRGGRAPPHRWPNSLQRYDASGPSWSLTKRESGLNSTESGGAEQSSSFVMRMMPRYAFGRRKLALLGGGGWPSAPSARSVEANWCSKPQPVSPSPAMQLNTFAMSPV